MPIRALAAALTCALALAACGGDDTKTAPASTLVAAADRTALQGNARFEMRATVAALGQELAFSAGGVVDNRNQLARMTLDLSEVAEFTGGDPEKFRGEQIIIGYVLYLRIPAVSESFGAGKPWVKVDLEKTEGAPGSFNQLNQSDPAHMLPFLKATTGDVEEVGEDQVGPRKATHYKGKVDLRKYPDVLAPEQRAAARATVDRLIEQGGSDEADVEAWIDEQGFVRLMRMHLKVAAQGQTADLVVDVEYLEFGVPDDFDPPPPDEVAEPGPGAP